MTSVRNRSDPGSDNSPVLREGLIGSGPIGSGLGDSDWMGV
jgi:hypothetical protein